MRINKKMTMFGLLIVVIATLLLVFVVNSKKPVTVVEDINDKSNNVRNVNGDNETVSESVAISPIAATNTTVESGTIIIVGEVAEYVEIARERMRQLNIEITDEAETKTTIKGENIIVSFCVSRTPESFSVNQEGQRILFGPRYYAVIVIDIKTKAIVKEPAKRQ